MNCKYLTRVLAWQCLQHVPSPAQERQNKCCRTKAALRLSAPWGCLALQCSHPFHLWQLFYPQAAAGGGSNAIQMSQEVPGASLDALYIRYEQTSGGQQPCTEYHGLLRPGKVMDLLHVANPTDLSWTQKWEWDHWRATTCHFFKDFNTQKSC